MALHDLPTELLLLIASFLDSEKSINALARTNCAFFAHFNPFLYKYHLSRPSKKGDFHALVWAVVHNEAGLLIRLLDAGLDLFDKSIWQQTSTKRCLPGPLPRHPIWEATKRGHVEFLEAILDKGDLGPRLNELNYRELLSTAATSNKPQAVRMFLERGVNPWQEGSQHLSEAARNGRLELLELLLADYTQRSLAGSIAEWKDAYRALGVAKDNAEVVRLLVAAGIDVNHMEWRSGNIWNWRPLHDCVRYPGPMRVLLEAGANPNFDEDDKWGLLAHAVGKYYVSPPRPQGGAPVIYSRFDTDFSSQEVKDRKMELIQLLFEFGADPMRAGGGWALHGALRDLDYNLARYLADKGARIKIAYLNASDQALLDQAVVDHEWMTVADFTPLHWSVFTFP
ncbi:ankyrin repeat-containing domain protein [Penicillium verhagenii]|uniref:ankyrin repeat-containing domain protein n=1 Tax=Penicillium verhagenii TaxID=1562060 RepID=UPI0025458277|nr:ankyrin repeat-containing domain protein [Penicillium verhagenii]KAJ5924797.1 ankyrin repeat-containing domain protein [Penicillium verhagenii]